MQKRKKSGRNREKEEKKLRRRRWDEAGKIGDGGSMRTEKVVVMVELMVIGGGEDLENGRERGWMWVASGRGFTW